MNIILFSFLFAAINIPMENSQAIRSNNDLDIRVKKFLAEHKGKWFDMNVPASDGQLLYDLILKGKYKRALEIGTSTGHSGIWIAWALSKTGGKLITVEIDPDRHKTAIQNFKEAGLSDYIDARLEDAHTFVKELDGPFDFVFSDADKDWYKQYFIDVAPKLSVGGCFTAHNVSPSGKNSGTGQAEFFEYVRKLGNFQTTVNTEGAGMSISYKTAE
jgi:caffeoyl-CoA O-methyltransferase